MSENKEDVFGGFEALFDEINGPGVKAPSNTEGGLNLTSGEAGSLAEEIDPEELESKLKTKKEDPKDDDSKEGKENKSEEEEEREEEGSQEEDEEIDEEEIDEEDEVKEESEGNDDSSLEDIDVEESEIVEPFFDLFAEELGWDEVDEDDKPKDIKGLIGFMSEIIESNSKPSYANEDIQNIDNFVKNGGDLRKYFDSTLSGVNVETVDLEEENNQKAVVKEYLKETTSLSDDKIDKRINRYEESGTLEEEAEDALELLKEHKSKIQERLLKEQENAKKLQLKEQQKFVTNVQTKIEDMNSIYGIPLSKKEKTDLVNYLFKVNQSGRTAYQEDYSKSVENLIVSAYFTRNKDKALNKVKKSANNDAIKDLKKRMKNKKRTKNQKPYQSSKSADVFQTLDAMSKVLSK